jgi:hypothetical protein
LRTFRHRGGSLNHFRGGTAGLPCAFNAPRTRKVWGGVTNDGDQDGVDVGALRFVILRHLLRDSRFTAHDDVPLKVLLREAASRPRRATRPARATSWLSVDGGCEPAIRASAAALVTTSPFGRRRRAQWFRG